MIVDGLCHLDTTFDPSSNRYEIMFNHLSNDNCAPIWGRPYVFALWFCLFDSDEDTLMFN